ncbi:ATP-binding protein [Streptomyces sp. H10-C2]|uniref:ATP-binding protein n=1 Tax=unclassified Streptomyces TaxID=2593676 RepID=UPI0024B98624|nr:MULTISPECIES: ATP-binding protein [unclassified Streptomyces]MDJ0371426.1 ATP-binding protein [Streptomyces sp. H10-C2]
MTEPLYRSARYDGRNGSIAAARDMAAAFLRDLAPHRNAPVPEHRVQDVLLVVSELVTNAGRYAPGPCVMDLSYVGGGVEVSVWDTSAELPRRFAPDPSRIGGHGMEIVERLCRRVTAERVFNGKRVRAHLDVD